MAVVPQPQDNGPREDGTLSLPGGMDVSFRTIRPEDVDALRRFHQRLGERTIYLRFFGSMKELSEQKAKYSDINTVPLIELYVNSDIRRFLLRHWDTHCWGCWLASRSPGTIWQVG